MGNHSILQLDMTFEQCFFNSCAPWCTWNRLEEGGDSLLHQQGIWWTELQLVALSGLISSSHCLTHIAFVCVCMCDDVGMIRNHCLGDHEI